MWLVRRRGLSEVTAYNYSRLVRPFLGSLSGPAVDAVGGLAAGAVVSFMVEYCRGRNPVTAKSLARSLRSFLRFAHATGMTPADLSGAVPSAAGWHQAGLPKVVPADQVERLVAMAAAGRGTVPGRRDYAVVLLIVRLGLRCVEVARLMLDDIDWRAGEFTVTGKGGQKDRLPLPADVGGAISDWLARGRPSCPGRTVFTSLRPAGRPMTASSVRQVVRTTALWAGIPGGLAAHRLRHTLASEMLRAGATLPEVGQVLRHRSCRSTAIYAKVDEKTLRPLAAPWPTPAGGGDLVGLALPWPGADR